MTNEVPQCTDDIDQATFIGESGLNLGEDEEGMVVRITRPLTDTEVQRLTASWRGHRTTDNGWPAVKVMGDRLLVPVLTTSGNVFITYRRDVEGPLNEALAKCMDT
ncbi:hypothetical protein [Kineococcus sp. R86509]|uniref:hypothetical protein n=1 Tax=Kineococcus sp. R86509 TaxID=3093851 RepID=UPI0036D33D91